MLCMSTRLGSGRVHGMSIWTDFIQKWTCEKMDQPMDRPVCYACPLDLDGVGRMVCPSGLTSFRNRLM